MRSTYAITAATYAITAAALLGLAATAASAADVAKYTLPVTNGKPARILEAVEVPPGATTLYLSGQLASPLDPKKAMGPGMTVADYGDAKTQTVSVLGKIKTILASHGYAMRDIIKMTLFIAPDPATGKMDFAGVNAGFETFFNVPENPTTVTRSAFQIGALAAPGALIEIEATAAKVK